MKKLSTIIMVVIAITAFACATCKSKGTGEYKKEAASTVTSKVVSIDYDKRLVTLKGPDGLVLEVVASDDVKNLPQVKVGDDVVVKYYEAISAKLLKKGETIVMDKSIDVATRAEAGQKPDMFAAHDATITASVVAIDTSISTVTLKGPKGNLVTVFIRDPKALENVKVGDEVVINYKISVAVSVEKPSAP